MEKNWKIKEKISENKKTELAKYHPIIVQLLFDRGIETAEKSENFFNPNYEKDLSDPFVFLQMEKAMERMKQAKEKKEKIAIFGDYDADGVTATALLVENLEKLGFSEIVIYIPDRQLEGYGINSEAIEYLAKEKVQLIITVDCGITSLEETEKAKALGMDIIITDHHHAPEELPKAWAIINPNCEKNNEKFQNLAGVGVAFKFAQALWFTFDPKNIDQLKWSLDLVAIGTVADCVPLLNENRVLTRYGMVVLSKTRRVGLLEMFKVGRILIGENNIHDTQKISFQIAPRINAAGRMDHASISYNLIREKNIVLAREMALEVESNNQRRQKITSEIVKEIREIAQKDFQNKKIIYAQNENWPMGILGLVAGKISDEFNRPTIILQDQGDELAGSLRSIPQVNLIEILEKCSELLIRFGGHAQAAGIKVKKSQAQEFFAKFSQIVEKELEGKDLRPEILIDSEITTQELNWDLMLELKKMEPFGEGNEEPVFVARNLVIEEVKIVGNGSKHLKFLLRGEMGSAKIFDAIAFGKGNLAQDYKKGDQIDAVFNLNEDEWNGNKKIQLKIIDFRKK